jgi:hypothetical protein
LTPNKYILIRIQTPDSRFFAGSKHNSFTDILLISGYIEEHREKNQRIGRAYARPFSPSLQYKGYINTRIYHSTPYIIPKTLINTSYSTIQHGIHFSFLSAYQMLVFNQLKTNTPFLDAILTTVVFTAFARLANYLNYLFDRQQKQTTYFSLLYYFYRPSKIIISGKNCTIPSTYGEFYVSSIYSDRFNSVLQYIITNTNQSIHEMKELYSISIIV